MPKIVTPSICGPFRESLRKKRYLVVMVDKASRYITLVAWQDEETLKRTIKENWILRFCALKEIHVDWGKTFESTWIKGMMQSMGIKLYFSSPYHHNTNGTVERQFRTIRDYISTLLIKGNDIRSGVTLSQKYNSRWTQRSRRPWVRVPQKSYLGEN